MSNLQNNTILSQPQPLCYVRQNSSTGVNPLCDKLRSQYGVRIDAAVNRSMVRKQELVREAQRNGWSRVRRPAPNYQVRSALRAPEPTQSAPIEEDVKIYTPARGPQPVAVGATGTAGAGRAALPQQRRGVNAMTRVEGQEIRRTTLETLGDIITGRSMARTDEKTVQKKSFPVGIVFALIICALLFMLVVYCSMQKFVVESDVSALESQVAGLQDTAQSLSLELEMKDDLREIETIATQQIGMVKKESVQAKYVSAGTEEKSVVLGDGEDTSGGLSGMLSIFGGKLNEIVEYLN